MLCRRVLYFNWLIVRRSTHSVNHSQQLQPLQTFPAAFGLLSGLHLIYIQLFPCFVISAPTCLGLHVCQFAGLLCWLAQEIGSHLQHGSRLGVHCSSLHFLHPGAHVLLDEVLQLHRAQAGRGYCQLLQTSDLPHRPCSASDSYDVRLHAQPLQTLPCHIEPNTAAQWICCFGRLKHK